jgi:hypothetical protein
MQEEFPQLIFADQIGRAFAEVCQLPHGSEVALVRPF